MLKTILITGATDGIGLETARMLASKDCHILLHGRNAAKLANAAKTVSAMGGKGDIETYLADLSNIRDVKKLATDVRKMHSSLDVLINNAGVFKTPESMTDDGLDMRFMVNTIAPYELTQQLLPLIGSSGRVINLSSAAQASVNLDALAGTIKLADMEAYAQSKLAITMWSRKLANTRDAPIVIAVNPGSMLGTNMVKEGFGVEGKDIQIGADILCHLALDESVKNASGQYFDNDSCEFTPAHADTLDGAKSTQIVQAIEAVLARING